MNERVALLEQDISFDRALVKRSRFLTTAVILLALVFTLAPAVVTSVALGSEPYDALRTTFPGYAVAIMTSLGQGFAELSAMVTFGALLTLLFIRHAKGRSSNIFGDIFEISVLQVSSATWALSSGSMVIFEMLSKNGFSFGRLSDGAWAFLYQASAFPKAWTISFAAALLVFFASMVVDRWVGLLVPLWASIFGVIAPVAVGQVLVGPQHDFGWDAGIYQVLFSNAAFGIILVAALRVASGRLIAPEMLKRIYVISAVALPLIVLTDVLLAWFKLAGTGIFDSVSGLQIISRFSVALLLVIVFFVADRAWRNGKLLERGVSLLLGVATVFIAAWVGLSAAMTRVAPPHYFVPTSISQVFLGFEVDEPPTPLVLFTHWRPNILFIVLALAAVSVYLLAVRELRKRGDAWPVGRTIAWVCGWAVVVFVTSSGFGKYSAPDFGIHMIVHMSLNMLAPVLLVMGGFVTLMLRASSSNKNMPAGVHDWLVWLLQWPMLRFIYNPLFVFVLFVSSYYGLYFSGIFGEYMRFHWAHQLMNVHFLIAGYLFYGLVIGVDRPPRPLPHIGKLGFVLAAMPFHAFFGVILMSGREIIAENFYLYFGLPWADLAASQYLGGGVAWAGGEIPLLIVVVTLGVQWSREDSKDAKRKDRHFDMGRDEEFHDYNRMLETLTARQSRMSTSPKDPLK